ncbi:hypothetical protein C1T31_10830 [Hanstruepera neustonica]|uniref:Uncharacterized protein n=1 Tax=Hanstruepera neustonica TaxID=1445657 RepID=A0A2K1DX75_9FLAO|nr:DUF2911 domain-containing protein [Hanstruepera neustonica]PNQ72634.1 hypothetical protein C1T31_10830 [Hanstruepera neustonica]
MKQINFFTILLFLTISSMSFGQLNTPRASQQATIVQRVGITDISVTYSRPSVNGRDLWGALVPYGMNNLGFGTATAAPWRAGADENTTITFSHDAFVEGKPIKAGTYGLFFEVKSNDTATLILSRDYLAWGSFYYDKKNDALRAEITTKTAPFHELLTFEFNTVNANDAVASLIWGDKEFPFKISVDVADVVLDEFRSKTNGQFGFSRQNWEQAAAYALNNGGDLNEALGWIDGAISGNFYSQKTFNNLAIKGQILNKLGRTDEYASLMDEAAALANKQQLNALGYQMMNAKDYDRAVKFFKQNIANYPEDPNGYDSLGECYKTMGENQKAIKNFKKSLSMNPPANVRTNSEKHLKELGAL